MTDLHALAVPPCSPYKEASKATLMAGKMAKGTHQCREEITELFYGINPRTFEIESVSRTRGGPGQVRTG
jgi:hypothetical protein